MPIRLTEVFGVSKDPVRSYVQREKVDNAFTDALAGSRQIVIYGSSKQGKTALLDRHLPTERRTTVHCGPNMSTSDLYRSLLRQNHVEIVSENETVDTVGTKATAAAKFKAIFPWIGGAEAETGLEGSAENQKRATSKTIEFNLSAAQDVGELLLQLNKESHFYVLENFHYLDDEVQAQFAFDLRTFEEMGIRFVILGVWRERNRLNQYNGDLQDRVSEIPVEPWEEAEFQLVVEAGARELNISFSNDVTKRIFKESHGSIAVVQELLRKCCEKHGVTQASRDGERINDLEGLQSAITEKVEEYASRHVRALETIASGSRTRRETEKTAALYLPYYFVLVMLRAKYAELRDGIEKSSLQEKIVEIHHQPANVRGSDIGGMLNRLSPLQAKSKIIPPLFDYDRASRRVKVVDSTLFFFIDNCDREEVIVEIPTPDDLVDEAEGGAAAARLPGFNDMAE